MGMVVILKMGMVEVLMVVTCHHHRHRATSSLSSSDDDDDDDLGIPPYAPGIICPFLCRLFGPIWAVQDSRYYQLLREHN